MMGTLIVKKLRYLNFCPDFIDHVRKQLDKKAKVDFKIYDVTTWETNIYNKHCQISKKIKELRQLSLVS